MISRSLARLSRAGLTLVEALLALAIGAVVVAVFAVAHQSLRRTLAALEREGSRSAALAALAQLAEDLRCAWDDGEAGAPALRAEPAPDGAWRLEFRALRPAPDDPDLRYARPRAIVYRLTPMPGGNLALSRAESAPIPAAPEEPPSAPIARFTAFRAEFLNGERWTDRWPPESGPRWPRLARVEIRDRDGIPAAVEIWIARDAVFPPARSAPPP